jgi:hypothetical protein
VVHVCLTMVVDPLFKTLLVWSSPTSVSKPYWFGVHLLVWKGDFAASSG